VPRYTYHIGIDAPDQHLEATAFALARGDFRVVFDAASPLPFTTEGVRRAFHVQRSRHAHGKVVVLIALA